MYCELYRCKGRVINGRIYMYIGSHLISEISILECVLPKLNIEESRLLAILFDQNSKHAGQAQQQLFYFS